MVRVEDASKINRIVERFKLATVDTASIKTEIQKSKAAKQTEKDAGIKVAGEKTPAEKGTPAEKSPDDFLDEVMEKPGQREPTVPQNDNPNPTTARTEKSRPSEPIYARSGQSAEGTIEPERKSVRQELKDIRAQREQAEPKRQPVKEQSKSSKQPVKTSRPKNKAKTKKPKER